MFAGLMSRCTIPFVWAASSASAISDANCKQLFERQRFSAEQMLQRLSFQQFHGDEMLAVRFVDLVNRADVRVIERGGGKGFALESFSGRGIILHFRGQKFQRDMAAQLEVFGFVDHTHPAAAELRQNAVMRDGFPDHRRFEVEKFSEHCRAYFSVSSAFVVGIVIFGLV